MQSRLFAAPTSFKRTRFFDVDTVHFGGLENGAGDGIRTHDIQLGKLRSTPELRPPRRIA